MLKTLSGDYRKPAHNLKLMHKRNQQSVGFHRSFHQRTVHIKSVITVSCPSLSLYSAFCKVFLGHNVVAPAFPLKMDHGLSKCTKSVLCELCRKIEVEGLSDPPRSQRQNSLVESMVSFQLVEGFFFAAATILSHLYWDIHIYSRPWTVASRILLRT